MKKKYDVGIIGVGLGANYGSVLTYFALHEAVKAEGKSVLMVSKIGAKASDPELKENHATRFAKEHYDVSPVYSLEEVKQLNDICDTFVIGSDQVFNYGISSNFGKAFYLDFVADDKKKISYASSFGHQIDFAPEDERSKISKLMQRFNAISVREDSGVVLCRDVYNVPATQVIEPIFLLPNNIYKELSEKSDKDVSKPYLLAYVLDPTPKKKAAIKHIANRKGLEIKIILDGFPWLFDGNKKKMDMDNEVQERMLIEDLLKLHMNASYVLTDSFHGTSFAVKFNKPFASIGNKQRGMARFDSMFNLIGNRSRFTLDAQKIIDEEQRFLAPLDYTGINKIISEHVTLSKKWLKDALSKPVASKVGTVKAAEKPDTQKNPKKGSKSKNGSKKEEIAIPDNTPNRKQIILNVQRNPEVQEWKEEIERRVPNLTLYIGRELKEYTFNKIGGPADILIEPTSIDEIKEIITFAKEKKVSYKVLGRGSNVLVRDGGIRGLVILTSKLDHFMIEKDLFTAGAGASLMEATNYLLDNSKANLEWACGIPGTIGGAVYMNAGTYTGDIRKVLHSVKIIDGEGEIHNLEAHEIQWGLRYTSIQEHRDWIILEATFKIRDGNCEEMSKVMSKIVQSRENAFPVQYPNSGSVFKWHRAPRLIRQAGLAGKIIGGAKISQKQPGFFINFKQATASDYEALINHAISEVYQFSGFLLEPEVEIIGERPHKYQKYTVYNVDDSPDL